MIDVVCLICHYLDHVAFNICTDDTMLTLKTVKRASLLLDHG